ncbi:hypothetical protein [Paraburkholderia sp. MM5477-R1]|uniref:hypothetical protein n=1 Tax=Paraburkholderia sp. MM5477-R1 TaxID=2991062 RepID=UPI003D24176A
MSDPTTANYHFQAWARRGIGASLDSPDAGTLPDRATVNVQIALNVQGGAQPNPVLPPPVPVQLYGPGDIIGIELRHIIRTDPPQGTETVNYEPNYLCSIEFDSPDFPWLFTPAAPNGDRLHPWLALIALKQDEFTAPKDIAPNPLPVISVLNTTALQDLSGSWNWAHVQISGDDSLADNLSSAPGNVLSRLICPRRLDPETSYSAFLVPAFANGVMVGLGQDTSGTHTSDPAWADNAPAPLTLPFYYCFDFHTSDEGDFESLVRKLTPRVLPAEIGQRPMDVSQPDPGIPSAGGPLGLEGALHSVSTTPTPWSGADKDAFQSSLQDWINQTAPPIDDPANPNPQDPVVVPPIYGRWHAAIRSVDRTAAGWENDLNLDPRNRSAAAFGTQVVQDERTQLMASAWQQVEGVIQANQMLRQAQLARAATQQLYRQHFVTARPDTVLSFTAPLHTKILGSPTTVHAIVRSSRVPDRMFTGAFRKTAQRPRHLGMATPGPSTLLDRVNSGDVTMVPPPEPPGGMVPIEQVSNQDAPAWAEQLLKYWPGILWVAIAVLVILVLAIGFAIGWLAAIAVSVVLGAAIAAVSATLQKGIAAAAAAKQIQFPSFTAELLNQAPAQPGFQVEPVGSSPPAGSGSVDSPQAAAFRTATSDLFGFYQTLPAYPPPAPPLDIPALRTTVLNRIDPVTTVASRMQGLISLPPRLQWHPLDLLEPIMAAPEFPQAMYKPLSEQYLLPGVELVPPDTMGLLEADHGFIESYMVGLNHEMSRQLLWNGYPTDQRGSYFRQFWDVRAYVPTPSDPTDPAKLKELLKDIPPINTWPLALPLGDHPNRTDIVPNNLVLLVRGELFKRYPTAIVYACKAKKDDKGNRVLDETVEHYPLFKNPLPPDMTFVGFNLSVDDARGGTASSPDGFFFVFQQQPSEPRFGLEPTPPGPVNHWFDLAWTNFAIAGAELAPKVAQPKAVSSATVTFAPSPSALLANSPWRMASRAFSLVLQATHLPDFLKPENKPTGTAIVSDPQDPDSNNDWGVNSAQTAYILLRLPFRILVPADMMLPPP